MIACTIAGSDSGGGAGIQADLKTFQELGVFGTTVITALTAQNTTGVYGIFPTTAAFVQAQLDAILSDFNVQAIKTGMLYDASIIEAVAQRLQPLKIPLIVDPVMIAKGGESLLEESALNMLKMALLPLATVCTPNIPEAEVLTGRRIKTEQDLDLAAADLVALGIQYVVMKGGHILGDRAVDRIYSATEKLVVSTTRIETKDTHGTGCTFSAALTAFLAKGIPMKEALIEAKTFIHLAIATPLNIGAGHGPTNHFAYKKYQGEMEVRIHEQA